MENNVVEADQNLIAAASAFFKLPEDFFLQTETVYGPPVSVHAMFRGKSSEVTVKDVDRITAELNIRLFQVSKMLENVEISNRYAVPNFDVENFESPKRVAELVRAHWHIPRGPIQNMISCVERAGVIVAMSDFAGASVSGVTFSVPGRPPIVMLNETHPGDRMRFTLAHELGHLVMHRFPTPTMEDEANKFASEFLLPQNEIRDVFRGRKITLELLASLKPEFKASIQSLLMAADAAGFLTDNQKKYLWSQISKRGWRLREPIVIESEASKLLPAIIKSHVEDIGYSVQDLAKMGALAEDEFRSWYKIPTSNEKPSPRLRIVP
jgi:Zn-dependent peptidase ImmA (M78 family)